MKKTIYLFILLLISCINSYSQELGCSRNGTTILYINGMFNSSDNSSESKRIIHSIYQGAARNEIDASGNVSLDHYYQRSLYQVSDKLGVAGQLAGAMSDIIQVVGQAVQDQIEGGERDDATFWQSFSSYFFQGAKVGTLVNPKTRNTIIAIHALDRLYQGFYVEELGDTVENEDLTGLMAKARQNLMNDQKKMIIVSHSQGNFFANKLWTRFFEQSDADESYKDLWGNMQLAPPTSFVAASHGNYLKAAQDIVVGAIPGQWPNIYFDSSYFSQDFKGHNVSLYLSPTIKVSTSAFSSYDQTAQQIFRENMSFIAKSLAPNCGCDLADLPLRVHPNGGGLVGINAIVDEQTRIREGSFVCGDSVISRYVDISNGSTIKDSTIQAALSHLEVEEIIQLGGLQSFNMDIVKIAHADIQQSRIKGNVTVGYGQGYNGQTVSIKNNSELVSFESDGEEYLRDGRYKRGEVVGITVATGFNLDKAKIYGKVGLLPFGNAGSYYLIQNSILNGLNTDETSGVSVSGVSIKNSSLVNSDSLKMTVQGSSILEGSEIVNIRAENTTLLGAFVSLDNANVSISDSFLSANINFNGNNNLQHLNFRLSGASANQLSSFTNTNISGYSLGDNKCNSINGTVEIRNATIYCSKIASNENKLQNVNIQNSELTFSSVIGGNVIGSMLYGGTFNGLELLGNSTLHAREGQLFDNLSLSNSYINLTNLIHGLGAASFENATIYGTGKLSIPNNYAFKDVVIIVDSLVLEQNVLLDGVQISGGGEVVIQESASIKNSSLSTDPGGDDPIILVQNGVEISDSRIMGNVIVEEGAKILLNSKVLNSQIREKATVNYSYIIKSELEANSKATELSQIVSSRIESNIEVVNSDIGYIELNESIVSKTCRPSGFEVFVCEDGVDIEEWEPFEYHPSATILSNIN